MDPDATLRTIEDFLELGYRGPDIDDACWDLYGWLMRGGFPPKWENHQYASEYYRAREQIMRKGHGADNLFDRVRQDIGK